ncbi:TPA: RNA polymerase sigma factor [Candidatus Scatousia excrementigallinarum]|uniref:RNA polymerase sigma factor n=1 Tax=Candidatus Scatousia excrementigallinarum TaxID=2840935 RepID=A0A9D1EWK3_9BACT|nr:RNA polymerase sigma factor [Candidatus Scatousia excrementigallinarum]
MTRAEFIYIMTRSQNGDKKALGQIYEEYFGKLCVTAFNIVKNTDAAYDIASNVILKLIEFKHDVSEIHNHVGYLITMTRNEAKNFIVKQNREISVSEIWDTESKELPDMLWLEDIYAVLTNEERELFLLHNVWDMTLHKTANCLGITYGAVKARYAIIKKKIKAIYEKGRK